MSELAWYAGRIISEASDERLMVHGQHPRTHLVHAGWDEDLWWRDRRALCGQLVHVESLDPLVEAGEKPKFGWLRRIGPGGTCQRCLRIYRSRPR